MASSWVTMSDGAKLYVQLLGDDSSNKPLLIVLHGAPGLSNHEEPVMSFGFLQSKFRVLVYDARGSGVSDLKGPYDHERWLADLDELRTWAGVEKFVLAGGSYGGFLALDYAIAFPNRLTALILRDTFAWGSRAIVNSLRVIFTSDRIKVDAERQSRLWSGTLRDDQDFKDAFDEIVPLYAPDSPKISEIAKAPEQAEEGFEGQAVRARHYHAATHNAAFGYNLPRFDVRSRLNEIKVPTLIVVGRHDFVAPFAYSEEIHHGIPNSQLAVFEKSGHSPPSDEPVLFRERVLEFVSSLNQ